MMHSVKSRFGNAFPKKRQFISFVTTFASPAAPLAGKLGGQDSFESIESFESCDRLTQSWSSQSSFSSLQRVPSYDSFDSEDYPTALHGHKPKGTFKDYVRERSDLSKDKPVIPAAALAGYTGETSAGHSLCCDSAASPVLKGAIATHSEHFFSFFENVKAGKVQGNQ